MRLSDRKVTNHAPIYKHECPSCGERFELRRGITDSDSLIAIDSDSKIRCPKY